MGKKYNLDNKVLAFYRAADANVRLKICRKETDLEVLEYLSVSRWTKIRSEVAINPNISHDIFYNLSEDNYFNVRKAEAYNPKIPYDIALKLSMDNCPWVRAGVGANKYTPIDIVINLLDDKNTEVKAKTIANERMPVNILEDMFDESFLIRLEIAAHKNINESLIEKCYKDRSQKVLTRLGANEKTPLDKVEKLMKHKHKNVRAGCARNPNITEDMKSEVLADEDYVKIGMAMNRNLDYKDYDTLYATGHKDIVTMLSKNVNLPIKLKIRMVEDYYYGLTKNVINRFLPEDQINEIYKHCAQSKHDMAESIICLLLTETNVPAWIIDDIIESGLVNNHSVQVYMLNNHLTDKQMLEVYRVAKEDNVKKKIYSRLDEFNRALASM